MTKNKFINNSGSAGSTGSAILKFIVLVGLILGVCAFVLQLTTKCKCKAKFTATEDTCTWAKLKPSFTDCIAQYNDCKESNPLEEEPNPLIPHSGPGYCAYERGQCNEACPHGRPHILQ